MLDRINKRIEVEESTSLRQVLEGATSDIGRDRDEAYSCSAETLLRTGALPGVAKEKEKALEKTKAARLLAYMNLDAITVSQTKGWRVRAAYRLVSYMARITGDLTGPDLLSSILTEEACTIPFKPRSHNPVYGTVAVRMLVDATTSTPYTYTIKGEHYPAGWLYLPPPIPNGREEIPPLYDEVLCLWCEAYEMLAYQIQIEDGTQEEPHSGIYGTVGLFNPKSARFLWPTRQELLLYEQELMLMVFDYLNKFSSHKTELWVMEILGYSRPEAVVLVKTALRFGSAVYNDDYNNTRVRELKMLEQIADDAGVGQDPRAQLAARKQLQLVTQLVKNSDMDAQEGFRELAQKALAHEGENKLLDYNEDSP